MRQAVFSNLIPRSFCGARNDGEYRIMKTVEGLPYVLTVDTRLPEAEAVSVVAFYPNGTFVTVSANSQENAFEKSKAAISAGKVSG